MQKHNRYACSLSFFIPGWKNDDDYMVFSARLAGLKILAPFENTGLGFSAWAELRPGWIFLHVIDNLDFKGFVTLLGIYRWLEIYRWLVLILRVTSNTPLWALSSLIVARVKFEPESSSSHESSSSQFFFLIFFSNNIVWLYCKYYR